MLLRGKKLEMVGKGRKGLNEKLCSSISLLVVMGLSFVSTCPSDCVCKWKGGKQTVECVNRGLRTFPHSIDPGTQVLDISGNKFETLPPDHFIRSGLINLQKIYLSRCQLSHINSRAFRGLSNLVDLDLSQNMLTEAPSPAFIDCQGLMKLVLNWNPIRVLQAKAFLALQALTTLELSHCEIERIEKGAFDGLVSLEWLKLNGNRLKRITGLASLPLALKGVYLEDNPWECDCSLLELRIWLTERNVANSVEPRCTGPERLANVTLTDIPEDNFACAPELSPTTMYQKIGEGKNVSLLCKVSSVPESTLEWWFNGQPVSNTSFNIVVETTNSSPGSGVGGGNAFMYQGGMMMNEKGNKMEGGSNSAGTMPSYGGSLGFSLGSNHGYGGGGGGGVEKKSELLILNATSDENGTFVCVARNPAGVSMANFTLRVLTKYESEHTTDLSSIPGFVSNYPNLMIIIISTLAVIVLVILLVCIFFLLCKCSRLCGLGNRRGLRNGLGAEHNVRRGEKRGSDTNVAVKGKKGSKSDGKDGAINSVVSGFGGVCGGKLDRHSSETSTLTTHTKSNGSVFLLSTSSELGLGDSNPDLIEGVKRVDGDGLETSFTHPHFTNGSVYCSNLNVNHGTTESLMLANELGSGLHPSSSASSVQVSYTGLPPPPPQDSNFVNMSVDSSGTMSLSPSAIVLEPPKFSFTSDYGVIAKGLNTSTLMRRSPSVNTSDTSTLPNTYDLAKYPKEYINPQQLQSQTSASSASSMPQQTYTYGPVSQIMYSHDIQGGPPTAHGFYPTYILPSGAYISAFSSNGEEEYAVSMGGYIDASSLPPPSLPVNCICAPILEGNELEEKETSHNPQSSSMSTSMNNSDCGGVTTQQSKESHEKEQQKTSSSSPSTKCGGRNNSTSTSNSSCSTLTRCKSGNNDKNGAGGKMVSSQARLQRQLTAHVNESPDEGYNEDESVEGTEI